MTVTPAHFTSVWSNSVEAAKTMPKPQDPISTPTVLIVALIALLVIAAIAITAVVWLSMRKTEAPIEQSTPQPREPELPRPTDKRSWHKRIEDVVQRYDAKKLSRQDAVQELALIARQFASATTGRDLTSSTLRDIDREPAGGEIGHGMNLFKQTINALYPPEFAHASSNDPSQGASVEQAAKWVSNLVERWRS